jgi:hypothetical protein
VVGYVDEPIPFWRFLMYRYERREFRLALNHSAYQSGVQDFIVITWYKNALVLQTTVQRKKSFELFDIFKGTFTGKMLFPGYMYNHGVFSFEIDISNTRCYVTGYGHGDRTQFVFKLYNISAIKLQVNTNLVLILISIQVIHGSAEPAIAPNPVIHNDFVIILVFISVGGEWHLTFKDIKHNKATSYKLGSEVTRTKNPLIYHPFSNLIFQMLVRHNDRFSYGFEINCAENSGYFRPMYPIAIRPSPLRKVHVKGIHYDQSVRDDIYFLMDGGGNIYFPRWQIKNTYDIITSILSHRRYR